VVRTSSRSSTRIPRTIASRSHGPKSRRSAISTSPFAASPCPAKSTKRAASSFACVDANNYFLTRANALEDNVRFYFVKNGRRQQVASFSGKVATNAWHELRATMRGDHVEIFWDGAKVIDARDATFPDAGKIGVWTKADSVTYFDDVTVKPL